MEWRPVTLGEDKGKRGITQVALGNEQVKPQTRPPQSWGPARKRQAPLAAWRTTGTKKPGKPRFHS